MEGRQYLGVVVSIKDTIANVVGLTSVTSGEMVVDTKGNIGLVLNLAKTWTGVVMFNDNVLIAGDILSRLFNTLSISTDPFMLSNVYDSLGILLNKDNFLNDNSSKSVSVEYGKLIREVELKAPGIIVRQPVYEPLFTGFLGIDGLLPLGQGQRELIIGDRQTGKTAIAVDIILNQSNIDPILSRYLLKKQNYE